jgi:hypothetical protein
MSDALPVSASDLLYLLCSVLLLGSAVLIFLRDPRSVLHRRYALTALSLLGWVGTLDLYYRSTNPAAVLWLGRVNFAAAALAVTFGYLLVRAIADGTVRKPGGHPKPPELPLPMLLTLEGLLLALLSSLTPLIDSEELVGVGPDGRHVTVYGPLFLLYALHILGYLVAAAIVAFQARRGEAKGPVRDKLTLVGAGVLATGTVGVVADIVLPYGFGDFRFTDLGPLSTALFLLAVGYAVLKHRLFDLRLLVRKTLVLGILGSLALAAYGAVVVLAADRFAGSGSGTLTRFGVLMIALSFDPLRRALEKRVDRLLFRRG